MWPYKLCYNDTKSFKTNKKKQKNKIFLSKKYNLSGKPDLIYKNIFTGRIIPVELKSSKSKENNPNYGDFLQLVSYFIILSENAKHNPRVGLLVYADYMFVIKNTKKFRKEVIAKLDAMQMVLKNKNKIMQ
jgi:CRISPR-associated exonuclease Cas4